MTDSSAEEGDESNAEVEQLDGNKLEREAAEITPIFNDAAADYSPNND
jgi:gentisate 1,2-dioxygenase